MGPGSVGVFGPRNAFRAVCSADTTLPVDPRASIGGNEIPDKTDVWPFSFTSMPISPGDSFPTAAQRYSIATVRPSIQPSARSRFSKAAVHGLIIVAVFAPRKPIVGSLERPRCRAAEQRDEVAAPHHSIKSARASSVSGTVSPKALAVFKLITSSYFVGACTGSSAGFSPLRMRST
jgi:hypothetical protein